jgi:hypothetical protein
MSGRRILASEAGAQASQAAEVIVVFFGTNNRHQDQF